MSFDPVVRGLLWVGTIILVCLLALNLWLASTSADTRSVVTRLDNIDHQLTYLSCINLLPVTDRQTRRR